MSCCRGRVKIPAARTANECQTLEAQGARTIIQVVATAQGLRLVVPTPSHGFMELGSFLSAFRCEGPTAKLLTRYLPAIQQAVTQDVAAFASYRSGINITDLIRVADRVTKGARNDVPKVRLDPTRR